MKIEEIELRRRRTCSRASIDTKSSLTLLRVRREVDCGKCRSMDLHILYPVTLTKAHVRALHKFLAQY